MGIEGGNWGERSRPQFESMGILKRPEQVFDSPLIEARKSSQEVVRHLLQERKISFRNKEFSFCAEREGRSGASSMQIAWPITDTASHVLKLDPIQEGRGPESGVFAYRGSYGVADRKWSWEEWKFRSKTPLEALFGVPDGIELYVQPTVDRWAIGKDQTSSLFGGQARTLYMGLGFLFLGHQWMHVGMHEAGHLPNVLDENEAWSKADILYASRHKKDKDKIVSGKSSGQFELLRKPSNSLIDQRPTIGKIVKYGLISHAFGGGAKIPDAWKLEAPAVMREFDRVIKKAHQVYGDALSV